jgi:hypothetical protein
MISDVLSHAIEEIERCPLPHPAPAIAKALAVMKALQHVLDSPHVPGFEQALADLGVSALVDGSAPRTSLTLLQSSRARARPCK